MPTFPGLSVVVRRRRASSSVAVVRRPSVCRRPSVAMPSSVVVGVVRQSSVCRPWWVLGSTAPRKAVDDCNQSPAAPDGGCFVEGCLHRPSYCRKRKASDEGRTHSQQLLGMRGYVACDISHNVNMSLYVAFCDKSSAFNGTTYCKQQEDVGSMGQVCFCITPELFQH